MIYGPYGHFGGFMSENKQFEKLSRELEHAALELNAALDEKTGYQQSQIQQARQATLLVLESVLKSLKILFKC
jgi:hypothetical protein